MKFNKLLDGIAVLCMVMILVLVIAQVVMRYVFNSPLTWSEELAVFVMIWLTFIGSLICMRDNEHIEVTILVDHMPRPLQRIVMVFSRLASIIFLLVVAYYGLELVMENVGVTSVANQISMGLVYTIIPLSSLGMVYYLIRAIVKGE